MDIRKLSEEERKKYIDGFKEYVANRNNSSNSQMINSVVDNAFDNVVNNTSTRGNYSNNNNTWNRVQNIANNNLNRFNSMQNMFDRNTRNEMAKPMEDYTNLKRIGMQNASNYVQEKAKQEEEKTKKNDKWLLFDNANKNKKDVLLRTVNGKEEIEKQIEQEKNNNNGNILETVYKKKNNIQDNEIKDFNINNKENMYEKNLAIHNSNIKNKENNSKNNNVLQDLEDLSGIGGLGTQSILERASNLARGVQDVWGLSKEVGLGVSTGGKQALNYLETTNEQINPRYKEMKDRQFLASPNVSMRDKMTYQRGEEIETNLVKKAIRESIAKDEQDIQDIQNSLNYKVSQKFGEIAPSMGQMLPGMALSTVNPMLGTSYFMTSAGGGYINDALNRGMTEEQAWKYGTVMGTLEGASESFITGQQMSKISNAFTGKQISKKVLDSYGFNIFENAVQEAVMEPAQEITAGIIGDKADWSNMGQRMKESGFNGALMGAITNGVTYGLEKSGNVYNKIKNNEEVTVEEYREALRENIDRFGKKKVEEGIKQGAMETYQEINNINNLQQNIMYNQNNSQTGQTNQPENKMSQNGNMEQIDRKQTIKGYHGTDANFENYSLEHFGKHDEGDFGKAVYFSTDKSTATKYGKNVKENNINLENPLIINNEQDYKKMWNELGKRADKEKLSIEEKDLIKDKYTSQTDKDYMLYNTLSAEEKRNILQEMGYDGVIDNTYNQIAVFNPNNIENNSKTVYNNTESEGGINGQSQFTNKEEATNQSINETRARNNGLSQQRNDTSIQQKSQYSKRKYNKQEYNSWEQSIKPIEKANITDKQETSKQYEQREQIRQDGYKQNERQRIERFLSEHRGRKTNDGRYEGNLEGQQEINYIKDTNNHIKELNEIQRNIKNRYERIGIPVNFYSLDNKNAGKYDSGALYINAHNMSDVEQSNVATHEYAHHLLRNSVDFQNEISPIADKMIENETSGKSEGIRNYIMQRNENINIEDLQRVQKKALEEILADYMIDIDNNVDFTKNNQYGLDIEILNEYTNIAKKYLPESIDLRNNDNIQNNANNALNKVEASTQSLGYKLDTEGKQRKHYKSVMESDQVGEVGKQSAKSLLENDTYTPIPNIDTIATANENINRNGVDNTYVAFKNKINSNERITLQDIATGERLIQIFSQGGDINKVNDLIQDVAILGTELGQMTQAMSLIKKASPEGQLMLLNKVVERTNIKENSDLKVSEDMSKRILEAKDEIELENVMTDIAVELGEQLPVSMGDKVRAWRYLSMLGNPKTHIKNLGANVAMNLTQQTKNKVAGAMEDVVGIFNKDMERTKTLRPANKDQRSFAKQDAEYMKDKIDGGGKYDIKNAIQNNKRQFDNKALNMIAEFNSNMLELEDNIFLKKAYRQALQNYMSANKLSSSDMQNSSVLQKAREYASYQAQEATFHQFSELAQRLTEIENKGGIAGKTLEAVVPFKKTPINIAKSGVEYSPIGLAKSLTYDIAQLSKKKNDYKAKLEKGIISETDYKTGVSKLATKTIDNMAKGLTGTSLALLGYALRDMEILKSGNDGEDDEFKEKLGEQEYAIKIGDSTYTLDWVSPSAIPMFIGATVHDLTHSEKEDNSNTLNSLMTSSAKALEPMTEMSMLQGLTSAISSYEQGSSNMLFDLGGSAVSSYFGQFVPTALGQVAKTIDDKERDTSSTEKGLAKKIEQFKKQQIAKIPIVSKMLPVRKDVWGNEKTRDSNILVRAYEVGLAPYNRKKVVEDFTEKELLKVFEDTGEKAVLPGIPNKDITINKQKYRLTAGEYNKAKETFGKTSKGMLDSLVKSKEYKSLTDEQKSEAINNIYSYAKEKIKVDYAKNKKKEIETTPSYNILKELNSPSNQSEYLSYSSKIKGIEKDKEKKQILSDGNYSVETKAIIYKNTLGKEDDLYNNVVGKDNININEYLKYKLQEFESDKEYDGTKNGKTISGSKKKKVSAYVDNMNITRVQKLAILGTQYKLNRVGQEELYEYLEKLPMKSQAERLDVFSKYSSNFIIYEDNTMNFK